MLNELDININVKLMVAGHAAQPAILLIPAT